MVSLVSLAFLVPCAQGAAGLARLLPCSNNLPECASASGVEEFKALYDWLASTPQRADHIGVKVEPTSLELSAFQLLREVGMALLGASLDYVAVCQQSDPRCGMMAEHFQVVQALRSLLDGRLTEMAKDYLPDTGLRSPVLRVGHSLRSDLDSFLRRLPTLQPGLAAAEASARLAQMAGEKGRALAWHLGMHFWVRSLELPSRGAPVLILHDEYSSYPDMATSVTGMLLRHGQSNLAVAEVGVPLQEQWFAPALVRSSQIQYVGFVLEPFDVEPQSGSEGAVRAFEQLRAELAASDLAPRMALHYATSRLAAEALPDRALDVVLLDLRGSSASVAQEQLALWESKVKPAGVLAGRGFEPGSPIVTAVCAQRFSTDLHLGAGGGFWWLVEPPEEEEG